MRLDVDSILCNFTEFKNYHASTVAFSKQDISPSDLDIIYKSKDLYEIDRAFCEDKDSHIMPYFSLFYVRLLLIQTLFFIG